MVSQISCWLPPPHQFSLLKGELHLWRISLNVAAAEIVKLKTFLSEDELERAERLLDRQKSFSFVAARGRLRQILALYLDIAPGNIVFVYGAQGKPELPKKIPRPLFFNLAHSGCWALLALSADAAVGVDVEFVDPQLDHRQLAAQFFSTEEKLYLQQFPQARQRRGFYRLWTRKEAFLKMSGCGFAKPGEITLAESPLSRTFPVAGNYLGSLSYPLEISSMSRFQLAEKWG
ncbi:MAG: 4'-phosphopantetheinyl transferase superfamily protein [Desulfuromonadales bacterium]|nr:4'-phosphopantetheinyl transferase superfamily protein [Desulfuromonadales bacterium]